MIRLLGVICLTCLATAAAQTRISNKTNCIAGPSVWYQGNRSTTGLGYTCQRWDVTTPHKPRYIPKDGGHHNFCRNPDHDIHGTWCYTTNSSKKWDYCNITKCPDDSIVIWTNLNSVNKTTQLYSLKADQEAIRESTGGKSINVSILASSNSGKVSEFWAVASDYNSKKVFFADYRSQYVGVVNTKTNQTKTYLEGMGHGIESMAYDWKTGNLYMSDSTLKWILVASQDFRYYTPVYSTKPTPAYGLSLHAQKRYLFFSTYKSLGSKLIRTDTAGKNATVLFSFPEIYDVTGITVDYADDRLYWTDFTGYGSVLYSSRLDGTNKTRQYYSGTSIFWGIATYMNVMYVTDVHRRFQAASGAYYHVWFIPKTKNQRQQYNVGNYKMKGKPRGITVMSEFVEYSPDQEPALGSCPGPKPCQHICLPRINAVRECKCSLGYQKQGDTNCVANAVTGTFMYIADAGQGKIFRVPIVQPVNSTATYSVQKLPFKTKITYMTHSVQGGFVYWTDKYKKVINKMTADGNTGRLFVNNTYARFLTYEPVNQNLYFIDDETQYIKMADYLHANVRTIFKPNQTLIKTTSLKQMAIDVRNRYIYWTNTKTVTDNGQIWRMKYDGSMQELVFDNLNWPYGITIDQKNKTLYYTEARAAQIVAVPLASLTTVNGSLPNTAKIYNLKTKSRKQALVTDVQVFNGKIYFNDRGNNYMEVFRAGSTNPKITQFGPTQFYRIRTLILNDPSYYQTYINGIPNPCSTKACQQLCVSLTNQTAKCLCKDGFKKAGLLCIDDGTRNNKPPTHSGTCPSSITRFIEPCSNFTNYQWTAPTWTDDFTPQSQLIKTKPSRTSIIFSPGVYQFAYTATDKQGKTGTCRFTFTVIRTKCQPRQVIDATIFTQTAMFCGASGKQYTITCVNKNSRLQFGGLQHTQLVNRCFSSGQWMYPNLAGITCTPTTTRPPLSTPAPSTSTTQISTVSHTTTVIPSTIKTTEKQTAKAPTTSSTGTTTNPQKKTPTTTKAKGTTKAGQTTTTKKAMSTTTSNNPATQKQVSYQLSSGATAAIVVLAVVLVIFIALGVVAYTRRGKTGGMAFPIFWKPREDTVQLQNDIDDVGHHYSVI